MQFNAFTYTCLHVLLLLAFTAFTFCLYIKPPPPHIHIRAHQSFHLASIPGNLRADCLLTIFPCLPNTQESFADVSDDSSKYWSAKLLIIYIIQLLKMSCTFLGSDCTQYIQWIYFNILYYSLFLRAIQVCVSQPCPHQQLKMRKSGLGIDRLEGTVCQHDITCHLNSLNTISSFHRILPYSCISPPTQ